MSLDEVRAWVCQQCGEAYFKDDEVDAMHVAVRADEEQGSKFARSQAR